MRPYAHIQEPFTQSEDIRKDGGGGRVGYLLRLVLEELVAPAVKEWKHVRPHAHLGNELFDLVRRWGRYKGSMGEMWER